MLAIIGGSGLYSLGQEFVIAEQAERETPYGETSGEILSGRWLDKRATFLARHGQGHRVPPHRINYRANLWAFQQLGVTHVIAVNAVGGIAANLPPQTLVLPDQIIDYTSGRAHSFADGGDAELRHIDFSWPYSAPLRGILAEVALQAGQPIVGRGTYGCTNGPRLESAAEIRRLRQDGCDLVGMTGMPEAALARELELEYACLALVVNWAAGIEEHEISMAEIRANLKQGMDKVIPLLLAAVELIAA